MTEKPAGNINVEMGDGNTVGHIGHIYEPPAPAIRKTVRSVSRHSFGLFSAIIDVKVESKWSLGTIVIASVGALQVCGLDISGSFQSFTNIRQMNGRIYLPWRKQFSVKVLSESEDVPVDALCITFE